MGIQQVSVPKGMRDFSPEEMARRNYIFSTIRQIFSLYGYQPLETPAMEHLTTLLGKYGDEGDKLLFRVLNSGNYLKDVDLANIEAQPLDSLAQKLCDRGLRYDLTVPFARYVSQHWQQLPKPFKRYQIQPVWRADRPQRGRYREFCQCDIDVVGSNSLQCEAELVQVVEAAFKRLGLRVELRVNNRKVLAALAERLGRPDLMIPITVAIDKLDKIGEKGVRGELQQAGLNEAGIDLVMRLVATSGSNAERLELLRQELASSAMGAAGIEELETLLALVDEARVALPVVLDLSLARGLNYYTGAIFEVKALDVAIGSVCGGGRYDNLTGVFGLEGVSGVGISFGADRIYDAMLEQGLFPPAVETTADVLIVNMGAAARAVGYSIAGALRDHGVRTLLYPDEIRMKKQLDYAHRNRVGWVVILGESELAEGVVAVKSMASGEQQQVPVDACAEWLAKAIGNNQMS